VTPGSTTVQTNPAEPPAAATNDLGTADPGWAWARYEPSGARPWGLALAAHLFRRAGFAATWKELQKAQALGPQAMVDEMLREPEAYEAFASELDAHESAAGRSGDPMVFASWWLRRLRQSPWPLLEKLTLFWHGHFAIRPEGVAGLKLTHAHVQLLRKHAFGEFPVLLGALANDPAMYAGLGGQQNRKAKPNLHFARPWLEVFTVGPEACTSSAVTNLARAWTGWFLYGDKLRFIEREHDQGPKRLLEHEGSLGRDDAVRLLANDPATARNVAQRLFRAFVSESAIPPASLLAPIAERVTKGSMLEVLDVILRSNLFFSEHAFCQRIKSPVELVVGLMRSLEGGVPTSAFARDLANLGQRLDAPPTVRGWADGADWLNTITLAGRIRLCESLARGSEPYGAGLNPEKVATENGFHTPERQARFLVDLLLPGELADGAVARLGEAAAASAKSTKAVLETILAQPEFQLN